MALSREKKQAIIAELTELFANSKMTVIVNYQGITVKQIQALRRTAEANQSTIKVVKNRLVIKALADSQKLNQVDTTPLKDMLLYVFNAEDEVAGAQTIKTFVKESKAPLDFVGAISNDGNFISADDVKALADLPSKDQLRAQLVGTINAPLTGFVNVLSGNIRGVLNVLQARSESLS